MRPAEFNVRVRNYFKKYTKMPKIRISPHKDYGQFYDSGDLYEETFSILQKYYINKLNKSERSGSILLLENYDFLELYMKSIPKCSHHEIFSLYIRSRDHITEFEFISKFELYSCLWLMKLICNIFKSNKNIINVYDGHYYRI